MFRIRQSYREDVDQVLAVAEHLDTVNLPADRAHIEAILERSERSFAGEVPIAEREFLFVLEDLAERRIIGTSMIYAQHGTRRAPHIFFRVKVLSELLPPLEPDGQSKLWEALGRKFTGLSYQEADLLSKDNKEFIHALFPDDPIHTELLPDDVRLLIGQVGPETKAVESMLRRIGFTYAGQIDPFDGGPHFGARTDEITLVRDAREVELRTVDAAAGERPWAVLAVELEGQRPRFRAIGARVSPMDGGQIGVLDEARRRLGVEDGQKIWLT